MSEFKITEVTVFECIVFLQIAVEGLSAKVKVTLDGLKIVMEEFGLDPNLQSPEALNRRSFYSDLTQPAAGFWEFMAKILSKKLGLNILPSRN